MSADRSRPSGRGSVSASPFLSFVFALAVAAFVPSSAVAEEVRQTAAPRTHSVHSRIECTCRALGRDYAVGATICLGNALFRCGMDLNVTSWQAEGQPCPQS